jgi:hypothetical protein
LYTFVPLVTLSSSFAGVVAGVVQSVVR